MLIVESDGLTKHFGDVYALQGLDLQLSEGVFEPVFSLEDVDGCDFTYEPTYRGIYLPTKIFNWKTSNIFPLRCK